MATERFTKQQFENALLNTGYKVHPHGFTGGEFEYVIKVSNLVYILIRSSVDQSGIAADTGEDSIRAWLVGRDGKPLGSKVSKYTTRVKGWEKRTADVIEKLYKMGESVGICKVCGKMEGVFIVKKATVNKGRIFKMCPTSDKCKSFVWLTAVGEK